MLIPVLLKEDRAIMSAECTAGTVVLWMLLNKQKMCNVVFFYEKICLYSYSCAGAKYCKCLTSGVNYCVPC